MEEKVTNVHEIATVLSGNVHDIVTVLLGNVTNVTNVHSSLGDEIAKLTVEVSKLSMLISKVPPNPKVGRKMDAILAATDKPVSEYAKKSQQKKKYGGLQKIMHGFVT